MRFATTRGLKDTLARLLAKALSVYFKYFPIQRGKITIWEKIVVRHLLWRRMELTATSVFEARFAVRFPDLVQTYLYFFGVWEPVITKYLLSRLADGDVFIDVGANVGYYTLLASRCVGANGRVFAIEAASSTYAKLQKNLLLNDVGNVNTFHVAVSDTVGEVPVWLNQGGDSAGATTLSHVAERRVAMTMVEMVNAKPLHQIIDPGIICNARFIKIDVEGAEWVVVKSLRELLKAVSARTEIIIEVNERLVRRAGGTVEALIDYFVAAGFEPFVIANRYDLGFLLESRALSPKVDHLDAWKNNQLDLIFRRSSTEAARGGLPRSAINGNIV